MFSLKLPLKSFILFMVCSFITIAKSNCIELSGCEKKYCEINQQIQYAKSHNHQDRVKGLTTALEEAKANCSDDKLKQTLLDKIQDSQKDIEEYTLDLEEAKIENDIDKIKKYQTKIEEETAEQELLLQALSENKFD